MIRAKSWETGLSPKFVLAATFPICRQIRHNLSFGVEPVRDYLRIARQLGAIERFSLLPSQLLGQQGLCD